MFLPIPLARKHSGLLLCLPVALLLEYASVGMSMTAQEWWPRQRWWPTLENSSSGSLIELAIWLVVGTLLRYFCSNVATILDSCDFLRHRRVNALQNKPGISVKLQRISSRGDWQSGRASLAQLERELDYDNVYLLSIVAFMFVKMCTPFLDTHGLSFHHFLENFGRDCFAVLLAHFLLVEPIYYGFHRFLHTKYAYRNSHGHHHSSVVTQPTSGTSHPLPELIAYLVNFSFPFLVPPIFIGYFNPVTIPFYFVFFDVLNLIGHSSVELCWWGSYAPFKYLVYSTSYHSLHHTKYNYNFVLFCPFWDWLFGTIHPLTDELFEAVTQPPSPEYGVDVVCLGHGSSLYSILYTPQLSPVLSFAEPAFRPWMYVFYPFVIWPTWCIAILITEGVFFLRRWFSFIKFPQIVIQRWRHQDVRVASWIIPFSLYDYLWPWNFGKTHRHSVVNSALVDTLEAAQDCGVSRVQLMALNKAEYLNNGGTDLVTELERRRLPKKDGATVERSGTMAQRRNGGATEGTEENEADRSKEKPFYVLHGNTLTTAVIWEYFCIYMRIVNDEDNQVERLGTQLDDDAQAAKQRTTTLQGNPDLTMPDVGCDTDISSVSVMTTNSGSLSVSTTKNAFASVSTTDSVSDSRRRTGGGSRRIPIVFVGGTGKIGSALTQLLLEHGYNVVVVTQSFERFQSLRQGVETKGIIDTLEVRLQHVTSREKAFQLAPGAVWILGNTLRPESLRELLNHAPRLILNFATPGLDPNVLGSWQPGPSSSGNTVRETLVVRAAGSLFWQNRKQDTDLTFSHLYDSRCVAACVAAAPVHYAANMQGHEVGAIKMEEIPQWWEAAQKYGFRLGSEDETCIRFLMTNSPQSSQLANLSTVPGAKECLQPESEEVATNDEISSSVEISSLSSAKRNNETQQPRFRIRVWG